jgi:hypothetical protein
MEEPESRRSDSRDQVEVPQFIDVSEATEAGVDYSGLWCVKDFTADQP